VFSVKDRRERSERQSNEMAGKDENLTENHGVGGSIPPLGTTLI
jgi:hypothetical protein